MFLRKLHLLEFTIVLDPSQPNSENANHIYQQNTTKKTAAAFVFKSLKMSFKIEFGLKPTDCTQNNSIKQKYRFSRDHHSGKG